MLLTFVSTEDSQCNWTLTVLLDTSCISAQEQKGQNKYGTWLFIYKCIKEQRAWRGDETLNEHMQ